MEFISTSAAFHGVTKMSVKQLEWDILKVNVNFHFNRSNSKAEA